MKEIELTDRTLVSLMAAIIYGATPSHFIGTTEGAVEKAEELLAYVEFPSSRPSKQRRKDEERKHEELPF